MDLINLLRQLTITTAAAGPISYCALCLRTATSRRLLEKHSLMAVVNVLNDEEVWPWKNAQDANMKVCFICEARLVSMLQVIELIRFGVMADHLLQCYMQGDREAMIGNAKDHPLRSKIAVTNQRFTKVQIYSNLCVTKPITINIQSSHLTPSSSSTACHSKRDQRPWIDQRSRHKPGVKAVPIAPKQPVTRPNQPTIDLTELQSQKPSKTTQTKLGKSIPIKEQSDVTPSPLVTHTAVTNSKEFNTSATNTPDINNTGLTQKLQPIMPHITVPNTIHLENGLTLNNSGKYIALRTPGTDVLLHAIYQGTDGSSYVPTLSVKIQNGRLTTMPTTFINSCTQQSLSGVDNNFPLMNISLPGLDRILSESKTSLSQADADASAINQLNGPSTSHVIMPLDLNHTAANNLGKIPPASFEQVHGNAEIQIKPRPVSSIIPDLTAIPETDDLQNEDPIDVLDDVNVAMEEDPLQQVDLTTVTDRVPVPQSIKSEIDNDIINIDINDDSMDTDDVSYQGTTLLGPLTNIERALIRIDILNGYRKPIVVLERLKILNRNLVVLPGLKAKTTNKARTFNNNRALTSKQFTKSNLNKTKKGHFSKMMSVVKRNMPLFNNKPLVRLSTNYAGQCVLKLDSVKSDSVKVKKESDATVVLSDSESEEDSVVKPVLEQHVFKIPKMKDGNIDWEDKIPMDVITYMDATDPMSKQPEDISMTTTPKDVTSSSHNSFQYNNDTTQSSYNSFPQDNGTKQSAYNNFQQNNDTTKNRTSLSPYESRYLQEMSTDGGALEVIVESFSERNVFIDTHLGRYTN